MKALFLAAAGLLLMVLALQGKVSRFLREVAREQ